MPDDAIIREPAFIKDLFEQKVFAEFGLARASREALATRNQTVRVLRWSTLVIGLFWLATLALAAFQLDSKILAFEQALEVMVKATRERDTVHARGESLDLNFYKRGTEVLLEKMAPLGDVKLWWFSIPGSWPGVTELHGNIQRVLFKGFQDLVFNLVRKGLNVKVSELTGVKRNEISTELADVGECVPWREIESAEPPLVTIAIEDLPEFGVLRDQVAGMALLESNLATFSRLRNGEAEMSDLRALLRYTWKIELPESLDKGGYQIAAMHQGYPFTNKAPGDVLRAAAACAVRQNLDRMNARFFAQNPVLGLSQDVAAKISSLSAAGGRPDGEDEPYADLLKQIDALDALLKNPRARWLVTGERDLGPAYADMLRLVSTVASLGSSVVERSRSDTQAEIDKLNKNISAISSEAVGPIVVRAADGALALSPEVTSFQSALALLLKQRFMVEGDNRRLEVRVDPRTSVRWDAKRLDDAIAMSEEQRRFLKDNLAKFPNSLQDEIRAIADRHLGRRMTDLVAKAELLAPEPPRARTGGTGTDAVAETYDFDKAGTQLVRLLTLFKEIGANATYDDLTSLLRRDAVRGLVAINRTLDGSELYSVRDGNFLWWQGARNPGLGAFRVADAQALDEFLGQQYGQAESLAALSAPLLAVVDNAGIRLDTTTAQSVRRLRGLIREVDRYKNKNPRSSVVELEAFIRTELAEIDGQNCMEKMSTKMGAVRDADFFQERQIALRQQLFSRCVELATIEARRAYAAIDRGFDPLRGRFPFGAAPVRGPGGEADPEDVVQFLKLYERYSKAVLPFLGGRAAGLGPLPAPSANERGSAAGFIDQMSRVRVFLGPLLPPDEAAGPPGYDLSVEFRVNQGVEVDGNKIVDWNMEVGDQVVKFRDPPRTVRWRPGMPISLTLRWAKDAPTAPVNDGTVANMSVDGKNVTYRFTGDWALVSLLKSQSASSDAPTRAEVRPHLLKFEFATQAVATGGQFRSVAPEGRARVFMRVTVMPGGKKDVLSVPVFPTAVPGLTPEPAASQAPEAPAPSARLGWPDAFGGMIPGSRPGWPDAYGGVFSERRPPAKAVPKATTVQSP
jgi:type VI secretion system protein ImpL